MIVPEVWLYGLMEDYEMPRKRHKAEEIVTKLRQVEVLTARGRSVAEAIRSIGVAAHATRAASRVSNIIALQAQRKGYHHYRYPLQIVLSSTTACAVPPSKYHGRVPTDALDSADPMACPKPLAIASRPGGESNLGVVWGSATGQGVMRRFFLIADQICEASNLL